MGAPAGGARARRDAARRRRRRWWPRVAPVHETRIAIRARDLDAHGHVDPAVLFTFLEEARAALARRPACRTRSSPTSPSATAGRWAATAVVVTCALDAVGRASFRTRETIATSRIAVEAATTLEVPGRALSDERAR